MTVSLGAHSKGKSTGTSSAVTNSTTVTGGRGAVFVVFIEWYGSLSSPISVVDSKGNVYSEVGVRLTSSGDPSFFSLVLECTGSSTGPVGGSSHTLTATFGETKSSVSVYFHELLDVATSSPRDQAPAGVNDSSSPYVSNNAVTTQSNEIMLAFVATLSSSGTEVLTWGNSFISTGESQTDASNDATGGCAYRIVTSTGTYAMSVTSSGAGTSSMMCWIITYKAGGSVNIFFGYNF